MLAGIGSAIVPIFCSSFANLEPPFFSDDCSGIKNTFGCYSFLLDVGQCIP
jgi:hypothetical protein